MKKIFSTRLLLLLLLAAVALLYTRFASDGSNGAQEVEIHIIHTNDTHSQFDTYVLDTNSGNGKEVGGVVERASIIEKKRQEDPDLIYLDGGDMVQGSPFFNIWDGEVEVKAMNLQGLTATTFGNHEFDNGLERLATMLSHADFPILSCNYLCEGTPIEQYVKRHLIIENKGVKIGITGVTADPNNLIFARNWKGISYVDPSEAANAEAAELRNQHHCDLVIVLSHVGYSPYETYGDLRIAKLSRDIDLIIGAHSHTQVDTIVTNAEGEPVAITQTRGKANPIGEIRIKMEKDGSHYHMASVSCDRLKGSDFDLSDNGQQMRDFIAPYREELDKKMNDVIGKAPKTLVKGRPQSELGNFLSDALREIGTQMGGQEVDMSILNIGGIRNDILKGDVTIGSIYKILPFENYVTLLDVKGKDIIKIIEHEADHRLEAISGLQITLAYENQQFVAKKIMIGGKPIDPNRTYHIVTVDYLAEGNGGMEPLTHASKRVDTGKLVRDVMIDYIKEMTAQGKVVSGSLDSRILGLDENSPKYRN